MFSLSEWKRHRRLIRRSSRLLAHRSYLRSYLGKRGRQGSVIGADHVGIVFVAETIARRVAGDALNFVVVRDRLLSANHHDSAMHPVNLARAARAATGWGVAGRGYDCPFGGSVSSADGLVGSLAWDWGRKLSVNRCGSEQEKKRNEQ
jgi:hypothetical protein